MSGPGSTGTTGTTSRPPDHSYSPSGSTAAPRDPFGGFNLPPILGLDSTEGLSAEFLVQLAQTKLSSIDNQLMATVNGMNQRAAVLDHVRSASTLVEEWRTAHHGSSDTLNFDEPHLVTNADGTERPTTLRAELEAAGIDPDQFIHDSHGPDVNNLDGLITAIRNKSEQLQQGSEIEQMHLQQLVQSRGQFVQMCSQVMSSMHETEKGIVGNIRG